MRDNPVLRVVTKITIPIILLFSLYVQFHGDYGPGGGVQAGVIFAAAFILYALVFGTQAVRIGVSPSILRLLTASGLLLFAGVGMVTSRMMGVFRDDERSRKEVLSLMGY